jgi:hypothetical protein
MKTKKVFYSKNCGSGIHNVGICEVVMYTYIEGAGTCGEIDATSRSQDYIRSGVTAGTSKLFSDGCPEQNKNRIIIQLAYALVHILKIVEAATHIFPVREHSYLPCDGDFRQNEVQRKDVMDVLHQLDYFIGFDRHDPSSFKVVKYAWNKIISSMKCRPV